MTDPKAPCCTSKEASRTTKRPKDLFQKITLKSADINTILSKHRYLLSNSFINLWRLKIKNWVSIMMGSVTDLMKHLMQSQIQEARKQLSLWEAYLIKTKLWKSRILISWVEAKMVIWKVNKLKAELKVQIHDHYWAQPKSKISLVRTKMENTMQALRQMNWWVRLMNSMLYRWEYKN